MKQSRAKSRPKVSAAQQEIEYEDNTEDVFKHYDNKFFDMDSLPGGQKQCTIPVPNMEIQELQEYVAKCYGDLYSEFNDFKSSIGSQLLSLQEEVQALSFHNSSRNDGVFPESLKESSSQYRIDSSEGKADDYPVWSSKAQVEDYKEYEKAAQFHHETRQNFRPESTSPLADEPSARQQLDKHSPYRPAADDEELIQHVPADAWSNFTSNMAESSLSHGTFSHADTQFSNATERKQDSNTYLSRKLHGCNPLNSVPDVNMSTSRGRKIRSGWSSRERNESLPSTTPVWQEETCAQSIEYEDAEEEHEQAIEKMVSEYNNHKSKSSDGVQAKDQVFTNVHVKPSAGRERFALKGWAASFLQQSADSQLPKAVNKQYIKQEAYKYSDEEIASELVSSEDIRGGELRMEPPVQQQPVEFDIPNKRPGVTLAKGSLSRSNSQEMRRTKNLNMNINSTKPTSDLHEKRQAQVSNQQKPDPKFPAKKSRGGIAWNVDELAIGGR